MRMQKLIILVSTFMLFLGIGCLSEDEADEVEVFVQDIYVNNDTNSAELTATVMYREYEDIEDARLVCHLREKRLSQWYATGITEEIVIGKIERGFNVRYSPTFSNLESGQYRVIVEVVDDNNEIRGDTTSEDFIIP